MTTYPYLGKPGGAVPRVGRVDPQQMVVRRGNMLVGADIPVGVLSIHWNQTPEGEIDGVNDTFILPTEPQVENSIMLFKNGLLLVQGSDYAAVLDAVIFDTPPEVGSVLLVTYQ